MKKINDNSMGFVEINMDKWVNWEKNLPDSYVKQFSSEFKSSLDSIAKDSVTLSNTFIKEKKMAIIFSVFNAKELLVYTIKELSAQLKLINYSADIFLLLNNGGGNSYEFLQHNNINEMLGVDYIIHGHTRPSFSNSISDPNAIVIEQPLDPNSSYVNLYVINQHVDDYKNKGKIRALRDIYEFLFMQCKDNGYNPLYLLAIDAETRLRLRSQKSHLFIEKELVGNPLAILLDYSSEGNVYVGASTFLSGYNDDGNFDINIPVHSGMAFLDLMHGTEKFKALPGGCTLSKFSESVAIMRSISKFQGNRVEDLFFSVVSIVFGKTIFVARDVVYVNRTADCSTAKGRAEAIQQMYRWFCGAFGAIKIVGPKLVAKTSSGNILDNFFSISRKIIVYKQKRYRLISFVLAYGYNIYLAMKAYKNSDDVLKGPAHWE